jgi:hypothetical protein
MALLEAMDWSLPWHEGIEPVQENIVFDGSRNTLHVDIIHKLASMGLTR